MGKKNGRENQRKAILVLRDGSYFFGTGFGAAQKVTGEVVFSTSMVGYPESLTDPSYHGQILMFTYPLIGNYGVPSYDVAQGIPRNFESDHIKVTAVIIHELCKQPHHWAATKNLNDWLTQENVPGIYGVDTRRLTKKIRTQGVMLGILHVCENDEKPDLATLLKEVQHIPDPNARNLVEEVTTKEPIYYPGGSQVVVVVDCGVKYNILRNLLKRGFSVLRVPYDFSTTEILEYKPRFVVLSNGPGDPKRCGATIENARNLVEENVPVMGICLAAQILALAMGGDTYKLKYGHRSQNQPVLNVDTGRCYITTQNHGYAIDAKSLHNTDLKIDFINANDQTVEGIRLERKPVMALQWHPEAGPGPYDTEFLFDNFLNLAGV